MTSELMEFYEPVRHPLTNTITPDFVCSHGVYVEHLERLRTCLFGGSSAELIHDLLYNFDPDTATSEVCTKVDISREVCHL